MKIYEFNRKQRRELGAAGREHVTKNYNFENYQKRWDKILKSVHEKYGSWSTRKDYNRWEFLEV